MASTIDWELGANTIAVLNTLFASIVLFLLFVKTDKKNKLRFNYLVYAIACFAWMIGDFLWMVYERQGKNPDDSFFITMVFLIPNLCFLIATASFGIYQYTKWNSALLLVDILIVSLLNIMLLWVSYFHKDTMIFIQLSKLDMTSFISIGSDILIGTGVFLWAVSVDLKKIPSYFWFISSGLLLFSITDMLYYYIYFQNLYIPNSTVDFLYILSFDFIAYAGLWKMNSVESKYEYALSSNIGSRGKWFVLFLYPLFVFYIKFTGIIEEKANVIDLLVFVLLIFLYKGARQYIQISVENERLLKKETEYNRLLKERVAEQVKRLDELENLDILTSLSNRKYFIDSLNEKIREWVVKKQLVLVVVDIDRFRWINNFYGHDMGDRILIEVAHRLVEWNKGRYLIARLGGDEFGILLSDQTSRDEIERQIMDVTACCNSPIKIDDEQFPISISLGISELKSQSEDSGMLLKYADMAILQAQSQGYGKYQFYDSSVEQAISMRRQMEWLLQKVDMDQEFELFYQPQYSLPDLKLVGAEALIRWNSKEHGYIPPATFIPIAEASEIIFSLGKWVLRETLQHAAYWNKKYNTNIKFSFNISPKQLSDDTFLPYFKRLMFEMGIEPNWIEAEITESTMLENEQRINELFHTLDKIGVSISMDDFGSGYSSLGYLSRYPFQKIKIDKSLIDNVTTHNANGKNVVRAAVNMANAVGLKTVAEGVENHEQLDLLVSMGCNLVQGYLLGRPVPASAFEMNLEESENLSAK